MTTSSIPQDSTNTLLPITGRCVLENSNNGGCDLQGIVHEKGTLTHVECAGCSDEARL